MNKQTLTVGIAAYNEEKNIDHLLKSILRQRQEIFSLEQIIVACDGCTDNTVSIVQKFVKKYNFIKLLNESERIGKSLALNKIYTLASSDFLLTFDADVLLDRNIEIELMVSSIENLAAIKLQMQQLLKGLDLKPLRTGYGTLLLRKKHFEQYLLGRFILEEDKVYHKGYS